MARTVESEPSWGNVAAASFFLSFFLSFPLLKMLNCHSEFQS